LDLTTKLQHRKLHAKLPPFDIEVTKRALVLRAKSTARIEKRRNMVLWGSRAGLMLRLLVRMQSRAPESK
jgi:hypothetical protein